MEHMRQSHPGQDKHFDDLRPTASESIRGLLKDCFNIQAANPPASSARPPTAMRRRPFRPKDRLQTLLDNFQKRAAANGAPESLEPPAEPANKQATVSRQKPPSVASSSAGSEVDPSNARPTSSQDGSVSGHPPPAKTPAEAPEHESDATRAAAKASAPPPAPATHELSPTSDASDTAETEGTPPAGPTSRTCRLCAASVLDDSLALQRHAAAHVDSDDSDRMAFRFVNPSVPLVNVAATLRVQMRHLRLLHRPPVAAPSGGDSDALGPHTPPGALQSAGLSLRSRQVPRPPRPPPLLPSLTPADPSTTPSSHPPLLLPLTISASLSESLTIALSVESWI